MDKNKFWEIISQCREDACNDDDAFLSNIEAALLELPPSEIICFHAFMDAYEQAAYLPGLWEAAALTNVIGCSDDGFEYFRAWLISQGEDVFLRALQDPDSLADLELPQRDPVTGELHYCELEGFLYEPHIAYETLTGRGDDRAFWYHSLKPQIVEEIGGDIKCPDWMRLQHDSQEIPTLFPRLAARCEMLGGDPTQTCYWLRQISPDSTGLHL